MVRLRGRIESVIYLQVAHIEKVTLNNRQLQIPINNEGDLSVFREIFLDRDYQNLAEIIKNADLPILDIGGHIGLFSLYAHCLNPQVPIYVFEPDEANFKALKQNLQLNHIKNVFPKNIAVAGESGMRELYISPDSHNHSFFAGAHDSGEESSSLSLGKTRKVQVLSLSDIFTSNKSKFSIENYSLIKLDCEGAEFEILNSLTSDQLSICPAYYIEYHEFTLARHERSEVPALIATDLVKVLQRAGFKTQLQKSRYDSRMGFIFARK